MSAFSHPSDLDRVPRLRLVFGERRIVGPGRADLLEGIAATGSIAGAGRRMGMSYKRAWTLVEELNATFDAPLVAMSRGGSGHGGAALTELGAEVLERYRRMQAVSDAAIADDLEALARRLGPVTDETDMAERK
ncbi:winged helix-turn-helix domain-containing protein [Aureimonas phyllosphaerae]|uniref:Molybdate transport system regulatory protein n=1 Tax=Aureimonas phyllosphaerae TaxID=1166078 RepID=A0A7W6BXC2_9HYPH|nr:LysR family transcriptional regulator [Aureimonas phyllosphaerae]MBB3934467.1 molybdate transport system regulatory protein [Aureimonas phyllosphaerae]MBB3958317.1 molybdate transport system regulatory protein [Aureimonas phyllosphaerae]SFE95207.1 molybdate transport system regulatory protein [Aureimonas phyllosphaerae]